MVMMSPAIEATQQRYALCIGINVSAHSQMPVLQFAQDDAQDMHDLLLTRDFASSNTQLLLGEQASTTEITQALQSLMLARPRRQDLVLVYFAGHGVRIACPEDDEEDEGRSDIFLVSSSFDLHTLKRDRGAWMECPLRLSNLRLRFFEQTRSRKVLFLLDSCHSGDFFGKSYRSLPPPPQESIQSTFAQMVAGRVVLSSCMPQQKAYEEERLGHGRFTHYLLRALRGEERDAARRDGIISVGSLFEYLSATLPASQRPVKGGVEHGSFDLWYVPEFDELHEKNSPAPPSEHLDHRASRAEMLRAPLSDHHSFLSDRLATFVGREQEQKSIWQQIKQLQATGGYLILSGQAGQGKSSLIAKLAEEYRSRKQRTWEQVAFHFIPFHPGPDHQVGLLRNLMARLILLYELPEFYIASEHRPALRDLFPKVLSEVAAKGGQEVIFIDGLDQIEEDTSGRRDLSFLPLDPPAGIVFVLGTRPDDTLEHLRLCKPSIPSVLEPLSFSDFTLLLGKRQITLEPHIQEQLYETAQANALFLGLVARELEAVPSLERGTIFDIKKLVAQIAHDPLELFTLSIARLKRDRLEWREVIKPVLGALLVAQRPLTLWELRHLLGIEDERVRDALSRMGGLLTIGGDGASFHYSLFHLKFYEYLQQNEMSSRTEYVFALDEVEGWHSKLVSWCEGTGIEIIWQQSLHRGEQRRREYARRHYVTHLYHSRLWQRLFAVLDEGSYGRARIEHDPSTRSFAQDLELGQQAAAWEGWSLEEGIAHLALLWRYTLLRAHLRSQADQYPLPLFEALLLLGQEQRVVELAELLTQPAKQIQVWSLILLQLGKEPKRTADAQAFFSRLREALQAIPSRDWGIDSALRDLALALAKEHKWEQALSIAHSIEHEYEKASALSQIAIVLAEEKQWEQAQLLTNQVFSLAHSIEDKDMKASALRELASALAKEKQWEQALSIAHSIEHEDEKAFALRDLASTLAEEKQWEQALSLAHSIEHEYAKASALRELAIASLWQEQWEQAQLITNQALSIAHSIEHEDWKASALKDLAIALAQRRQWEQAFSLAHSIEHEDVKAFALRDLASTLAKEKQWEQALSIAHSIEHEYAKAFALSELASTLAKEKQWEQALSIAHSIEDKDKKASTLSELVSALAKEKQWEQALSIAHSIEHEGVKAFALRELAIVLAEEKQWEQALSIAHSIEHEDVKASALRDLASTLAEEKQWEQAERILSSKEILSLGDVRDIKMLIHIYGETEQWNQALHRVQNSWLQAKTTQGAYKMFPLALAFLSCDPSLDMAFFQAFAWVDAFFQHKDT